MNVKQQWTISITVAMFLVVVSLMATNPVYAGYDKRITSDPHMKTRHSRKALSCAAIITIPKNPGRDLECSNMEYTADEFGTDQKIELNSVPINYRLKSRLRVNRYLLMNAVMKQN